jgi:hypothetical protein
MTDYAAMTRLLMQMQPPPQTRPPYSGEANYFAANPNVAGMATEDKKVILNPHSQLTPEQQGAVAKNEGFRLQLNQTPAFKAPQYGQGLLGGHYERDPAAARQTIAARVASGDKSARATPEQQSWVYRFLLGQGRP